MRPPSNFYHLATSPAPDANTERTRCTRQVLDGFRRDDVDVQTGIWPRPPGFVEPRKCPSHLEILPNPGLLLRREHASTDTGRLVTARRVVGVVCCGVCSHWRYRAVMDEWADPIIDVDRRKADFLLGWREEIEAIEAYTTVPINPWAVCDIAPEHVIARLGPELTATARAVYRLQRDAAHTMENVRDPEHPEVHRRLNVAWGARQAFAIGLGVHLGLDLQHGQWLAEGLSGYVDDDLERLKAWKNRQSTDRGPGSPA